jgi:hypothetical protein
MANQYVIMLFTKKPRVDKDGDQLAREALDHQNARWPIHCTLVPRSEEPVYRFAIEQAQKNAREAGHGFKVIDSGQALVEVTIKKNEKFQHVLKKYIRVLRPMQVLAPGAMPGLVTLQ